MLGAVLLCSAASAYHLAAPACAPPRPALRTPAPQMIELDASTLSVAAVALLGLGGGIGLIVLTENAGPQALPHRPPCCR